jgi:hypothetical protein
MVSVYVMMKCNGDANAMRHSTPRSALMMSEAKAQDSSTAAARQVQVPSKAAEQQQQSPSVRGKREGRDRGPKQKKFEPKNSFLPVRGVCACFFPDLLGSDW